VLAGLPLWSSRKTATVSADLPWEGDGSQDAGATGFVAQVTEIKARNRQSERVPRIQCPLGYHAYVYARDLVSPDGLAFDPAGILHVAEEEAGRVSRIEPQGTLTTVVDGLTNPEGIAFDPAGNLYVVEDVQGGRLVRVAPDGTAEDLATNLDAPEGVVWTPGGTIYVTESNVEFTESPTDFQTRVTAISPLGQVTAILTDTLFWSYAGITLGADALLYVSNEASGFGTYDAVITMNPDTGERTPFASGLVAPEGLRFASDGHFPLYVAQELVTESEGRLSLVASDGKHSAFCTGFYSIEDIAVDQKGHLYVSEDGSGWIIVVRPSQMQIYLPIVMRTRTATR
jgi:sugar lactone lactonase YvrE